MALAKNPVRPPTATARFARACVSGGGFLPPMPTLCCPLNVSCKPYVGVLLFCSAVSAVSAGLYRELSGSCSAPHSHVDGKRFVGGREHAVVVISTRKRLRAFAFCHISSSRRFLRHRRTSTDPTAHQRHVLESSHALACPVRILNRLHVWHTTVHGSWESWNCALALALPVECVQAHSHRFLQTCSWGKNTCSIQGSI